MEYYYLAKPEKKKKQLKQLNTIEDLLHSRRKNPVATLQLIKDMARRIKKLEKGK